MYVYNLTSVCIQGEVLNSDHASRVRIRILATRARDTALREFPEHALIYISNFHVTYLRVSEVILFMYTLEGGLLRAESSLVCGQAANPRITP
jgi:hypothetical protein